MTSRDIWLMGSVENAAVRLIPILLREMYSNGVGFLSGLNAYMTESSSLNSAQMLIEFHKP